MSKKYNATNFLRSQTLAAAFLAVEVLSALQIGFGNPLAWLLSIIAAWNAALLIGGTVGVAIVAAKSLNEKDN